MRCGPPGAAGCVVDRRRPATRSAALGLDGPRPTTTRARARSAASSPPSAPMRPSATHRDGAGLRHAGHRRGHGRRGGRRAGGPARRRRGRAAARRPAPDPHRGLPAPAPAAAPGRGLRGGGAGAPAGARAAVEVVEVDGLDPDGWPTWTGPTTCTATLSRTRAGPAGRSSRRERIPVSVPEIDVDDARRAARRRRHDRRRARARRVRRGPRPGRHPDPAGRRCPTGRRDPGRRPGLRDLQERGPQHAGRRVPRRRQGIDAHQRRRRHHGLDRRGPAGRHRRTSQVDRAR